MPLIVVPPQSEIAWKVALTAFHGLAFLFTSFRVTYQVRTGRLWWDDHVVILAQAVDIYYCIIMWFDRLVFNWDGRMDHIPTLNLWITAIPCYILLWTTRIALALSFGKIFPPTHRYRLLSYVLTLFSIVCLAIVLLCTMFICPNTHGATQIRMDLCKPRYDAFGFFICTTDFLGDIALVALPFHALWRIKLPLGQRRLIFTLFSGSLMTLFAVVLIVFILYGPFVNDLAYVRLGMMVGHVAAITSLIVANLLVVGSFFYRATRAYPKTDAHITDPPCQPRRNPGLTEFDTSTGVSPPPSSLLPSTASGSALTYASDLTRISDQSLTFGSFVPSRQPSERSL